MGAAVFVTAAVEGMPDEAALRKLCRIVGAELGDVFGRSGKGFILERINGYNNSARYRHWVVLVDLDNDYLCPPPAIQSWLVDPAPLMCFRIAVRELEAWLLADRESIAEFLRVRQDIVPEIPDELPDPKLALINLARRSHSRGIREDMVPDRAAGQSEGPAYTSRLLEFISRDWRPEIAAEHSLSLNRCIAALRRLVAKPYPVRQD
jgi:hypothetical protein